MKYLADRNLGDAPLVLVKWLNGCNVYIPKAYDTLVSYLKPGCPIWIQVGERTWKVYELEGNMHDIDAEIEAIVDSVNFWGISLERGWSEAFRIGGT